MAKGASKRQVGCHMTNWWTETALAKVELVKQYVLVRALRTRDELQMFYRTLFI